MSVYCPECGSTSVRQAHLRLSDAIYLLTFRYPVRCHACRRRWHALLSAARLLPQSPERRLRTDKR